MSPLAVIGVVFVLVALGFVCGAVWEGTRRGGSLDAWDAANGGRR